MKYGCEHGLGGEIIGRHGDIVLVCCRKCNQVYMDDNNYYHIKNELEQVLFNKFKIPSELLK